MKASTMPEVKFNKRPDPTDSEVIANLRRDNKRLEDEADNLRDLVDEQCQRIAELEAQLARAIKTGGVPF